MMTSGKSRCEKLVLMALEDENHNLDNSPCFGSTSTTKDDPNIIAGPSCSISSVLTKDIITIPEVQDFDSDCSIQDPHYEPSSDSESTDKENVSSIEAGMEENLINEQLADTEITQKRGRWKKAEPSKWKRNIKKKQKIESKAPKVSNCEKCRFQCNAHFSEELRKSLCHNFWHSEYSKQKEFLLGTTESIPPLRRRVRTESSRKERTDTKIYYLNNDVQKIRVCKSFFLKTLCISADMIDTAYKGKGEGKMFVGKDNRGKKTPHNKTVQESIERVKSHIEKFPTMESHYSRKETKRLYLDPQLSITKMYNLYKQECLNENVKHVSEITYRRIFCTDYNLSFYKPKKDQCQLCTKYNSLKVGPEKQLLENDYVQHIMRKEECMNAKADDKEKCQQHKEFMCCTFDLQSVLQIPSSDVSSMYYSLKVCMYNFTIYELREPNDAFCYGWTELQGKRGSSEVGSCLLNYINQMNPEIKQLCLYSDTCGGQNRNQNVAALFLYLVQTSNLEIIEHKFLESGHTFMEVDSMHSAIEKAKKYVPVYTIQDWFNIFRIARSRRVRNKKSTGYNVRQMNFSDFRDLTDLSTKLIKNRNKNTEGSIVNWLKIKCLKYEKNKPGVIQYRYDHTSEFKVIQVFGKTPPNSFEEITLQNLYSKIIPITGKKKNSLLQLCRKGDIPEEFHGWYKSLPTSKSAVDEVPSSTNSDEDIED
uniref:Uncharacterized protein LOC114338671 n=1 Tax=Diabrotica virgifera virgifera TaxID=50390 RepID=A0A6P7G7I4_DIAVI